MLISMFGSSNQIRGIVDDDAITDHEVGDWVPWKHYTTSKDFPSSPSIERAGEILRIRGKRKIVKTDPIVQVTSGGSHVYGGETEPYVEWDMILDVSSNPGWHFWRDYTWNGKTIAYIRAHPGHKFRWEEMGDEGVEIRNLEVGMTIPLRHRRNSSQPRQYDIVRVLSIPEIQKSFHVIEYEPVEKITEEQWAGLVG